LSDPRSIEALADVPTSPESNRTLVAVWAAAIASTATYALTLASRLVFAGPAEVSTDTELSVAAVYVRGGLALVAGALTFVAASRGLPAESVERLVVRLPRAWLATVLLSALIAVLIP
jgi:hypothetical protein